MAIYSGAQTSAVATAANGAGDVACNTGARPKVMEYGYFLGAATASVVSLRRSSALGTRTSPLVLNPEEPAEPALVGINLVDQAVAFSVQPTLVTPKLRYLAIGGAIGAGMIWTFPRGLVIANSLSIVLQNEATNAASSYHNIVCDI